MVQFDNQYRQVKVKIVYYGPALGGKTSCLQHIHRVTDPQRRTRLYSLNTASDRTLFFDLLSLNLGRIRGYRLAIQLYTVPGQVQYNATRRAVLAGADGIVFVADSQTGQRQANIESLVNLRTNLEAIGIEPDSLPVVLQYNKRDLEDVLDVDTLDADLEPGEIEAFPSVAITGHGVMGAFAAIVEATLVSLADRLGIDVTGHALERLTEQVRAALEPFLDADRSTPSADDVEVTVPEGAPDETGPLSQENLVGEAVRANLAMTDLSTRLEAVGKQLERRAMVSRAIVDFGRTTAHQKDPADVLRLLARTAVSHLRVQAASVLIGSTPGELREGVVHGLEGDPLLGTGRGEASAAAEIASGGEPLLIARDLEGDTANERNLAIEKAGFASAIAVPLRAQDRLLGMLVVYRSGDRQPLDEDDLELATILSSTAALGYANALAFRRLEQSNVGLESTVQQRTEELRASLDEITRLNKVKNELIFRVASRLESPIASLVTASGALSRLGSAPPEKTAKFIELIRRHVDELAEVGEGLSQASFLVAETDRGDRTPTELQDLLRHAVSPLKDLARQHEVDIKLLAPTDLTTISVDAEALETALRAVVKNAIEHNRPGGEVRVEVRRVTRGGEPWVELRVADTGVGIPQNEHDRIFDAFWQGSAVDGCNHRGLGLGLAIARHVVERHGGTIKITARQPIGTQVSLVLPQSATAPASPHDS